MDVIDVGTFLVRAFADWFAHEPAQSARSKVEPKQVLVVEPNAFIRDLLSVHLAGAGWRVTVADGDAEAHRLTESERVFNLVLANIQSPGVDAASLARRLRASPRWNHTTLVALVDSGDEEDIALAHEAGYDLCLPKANWDTLVEELRGLLGVGVEAPDAHKNGSDHNEHTPAAHKSRAVGGRKGNSRRANGRNLTLVEGA
jgi:CheY-like chemotaxis protein